VGVSGQPSDEEIVNHLTGRAESQRVTELIQLAAKPARVELVQDPDTGEQRWKLTDAEWDLIGLVCDRIDEANPDLPIEQCQRIARDIIQLVRGADVSEHKYEASPKEPVGPGDKPADRAAWWNSDNLEHLWFVGPDDRFVPVDRRLEVRGELKACIGGREALLLRAWAEAILRELT
jgi:hypothetical protein